MFAPLGFDNEKFKTELCVKFQELGSCPYNTRCRFAHGEAELRQKPKPKQYKTRPCNNFMQVPLYLIALTSWGDCVYLSLHPSIRNTKLSMNLELQINTDSFFLSVNRQVNVHTVLVVTSFTVHRNPLEEVSLLGMQWVVLMECE